MNNGLFTVGLILLILGIFAYAFPFTEVSPPYRVYTVPLIILGIVLMLIGSVIPSVSHITEHEETPTRRIIHEHVREPHTRKTKTIVREE